MTSNLLGCNTFWNMLQVSKKTVAAVFTLIHYRRHERELNKVPSFLFVLLGLKNFRRDLTIAELWDDRFRGRGQWPGLNGRGDGIAAAQSTQGTSPPRRRLLAGVAPYGLAPRGRSMSRVASTRGRCALCHAATPSRITWALDRL